MENMNENSIYLLTVLIINVRIISSSQINISVISDCDNSFNISLFEQISRYNDIDGPINFHILNPSKSIFCARNAFSLLVNSLQDNDTNIIIGAIHSNYCELTQKLSLLYSKFVITWNCTEFIHTQSLSIPYFLRISKTPHLQSGITVLRDTLLDFKWKSSFIIILKSIDIIGKNSSADNLIFKINQLFYEKDLIITDSILVGEESIAKSTTILRKLTKVLSSTVKCVVIISTDSQTSTALRHLQFVYSFLNEQNPNLNLALIYLSISQISKIVWMRLNTSLANIKWPKLILIPTSNLTVNQKRSTEADQERSMLYSEAIALVSVLRRNSFICDQKSYLSNCIGMANISGQRVKTPNTSIIEIDRYGQRAIYYTIYCMNCTNYNRTVIIPVYNTSNAIERGNLTNLPKADDECYFSKNCCQLMHNITNNKDPSFDYYNILKKEDILAFIMPTTTCFMALTCFILYIRKKLYENEIHRKILMKSNDVEIGNSLEYICEKSSMEGNGSRFIAKLEGENVHLKPITQNLSDDGKNNLKPKTVRHLLKLYGLKQENITKFIGIFKHDSQQPNFYVFVWEYCSRGSLADIIPNTELKLDWHFKVSLLGDLVKGMKYLHNSVIQSHGWLNSHNCVIDNRWILKVTNFGINKFRELQSFENSGYHLNDLLWVAPELLRSETNFKKGSQKGDVYSFAVIMQEVITREKPFFNFKDLTTRDIIDKLKHPNPTIIRPEVGSHSASEDMFQIMFDCWTENPDERPSFDQIYDEFQKCSGEREKSLIDTMLLKIEKYSNNLEELVKERTEQLEEERKRTERLLYKMLPIPVANSLRTGIPVQPEKFEEVTIFFSDIVGFTTIAAYSEPLEVITVLNDLYIAFDDILTNYNVYKVETIGDAYMVVSGLPHRNIDHSEQIASMALEILHICVNFKMKHMPTIPLLIRCGIHTGPVVSGVVGNTNPRYCLFGDTVNIASRLESTGRAHRIHISKSTEQKLRPTGNYIIKYRGEVSLKGRGKQPTFYLLGKVGFDKELPQPMENEGNNHGIQDEEVFMLIGREKQLL